MIGYILLIGIGVVDIITGNEMAFSLFYLIPVMLVTWFSGRNQGIIICLVAAIIWYCADIISGQVYSQPAIGYWNAAVRFGFFVLVTLLLPTLKALESEREFARIDYLTGIANRRHFFELLNIELERSQRYKHPFTLAYIDLDGFKLVNDKYGHQTGDDVLCKIVTRTKSHLRKTDMMARLGGDEFILLLPETDQDTAQVSIPRIQSALLDEMKQHQWSVTFSMGALTYQSGEISADELVNKADDLMYSVKKSGKNSITYAVYSVVGLST
jgi:diguanylate cyclase (GGDEF)-like protein